MCGKARQRKRPLESGEAIYFIWEWSRKEECVIGQRDKGRVHGRIEYEILVCLGEQGRN